jgi:hypothetical protein
MVGAFESRPPAVERRDPYAWYEVMRLRIRFRGLPA